MIKNILLTLLGCGILFSMSTHSIAAEKITICGTGDSQALLRLLAAAFEKDNAGTNVEVPDSIGSSGGIKATFKGKCDLGRIARPLKKKEEKYELSWLFFAKSPIVFFANLSLTNIPSLTSKQIVSIYSGQTILWQDIGNLSGRIYVASRECGDSSRSGVEKNLSGFKEIQNYAGKILYTTPETVKTVLQNNNTIGYSPLSALLGRENVHIFHIDNVVPDQSSVTDGSYDLITPLGLVWRKGVSEHALQFINFLGSPEAVNIIIDAGAFPVPIK
jgi:phosphate transport system substrate-binding protein